MNNTEYNRDISSHVRLAYKAPEAASLLGVHHSTIRNLVDAGKLESVGGLRHLIIPAKSIERFLQGKNGTNPPTSIPTMN